MRLDGRVALVTGGGTGIGAAIARRFAAEGASVAVMGRRAGPVETIASELGGLAVAGNAAVAADASRAVEATVERFGGLDVLVANAGGEGGGAVLEVDDEAWRAGLDANLTSAFACARAALPRLLERGGTIVVVSSVVGLTAGPGMAGYTAAKHALVGLTRSLAVDYGPRVRVNALCPGWVRTPMSERELDDLATRRGVTRDEAFAMVSAHLPLRRVAEPDEIAAAALFLACDESSFVTGSVLVVDGGGAAVDVGTLAFG